MSQDAKTGQWEGQGLGQAEIVTPGRVMTLQRMGPFVCDLPGCISSLVVPNMGPLHGLYLLGRRPADLVQVSVRINGLLLFDFPGYTDEEGHYTSGGEMARDLSAYMGPTMPRGVPIEFPAPCMWSHRDFFEVRVQVARNAGPGVLVAIAKVERPPL